MSQCAEDLLDLLQMYYPCSFVDGDIINIYDQKIIGEWAKNIFHHPQEGFWRICQSERHDQQLKKAFLRFEGSLPDIGLLNWQLMIARLQVNLAEKLAPFELMEEVIDPRNGIPIPYYDLF